MVLKKIKIEKNDLKFRKFNLMIFIISMILFLVNKFIFKSFCSFWFFNFYFNDLLATIVLFSFFNAIFIAKLTNVYVLFFITILAAFFWEYVALFFKSGSIFDYSDVICYLISFLIYVSLIHFYKYKLNN